MNFQWILLALFLIAVIVGTVKALKRDMLKNLLKLATLLVAFLITFFMQLGGFFEGIAFGLAEVLDLSSMLGDFAIAETLLVALAGTIESALLFGIVFLILLGILRLILFIVLKAIRKNQETVKAAEPTAIPVDAVTSDEAATPDEAVTPDEGATLDEKATLDEGATPSETATPVADESVCAQVSPKKKKPIFYKEKAWRRIVSVSSGVICGVLLLSVLLMPVFYLMSLASTAIHATDSVNDADDSQITKVVEVVDHYVVEPYETSFVASFYDALGLSDLMVYTAKLGGRIELENGEVVYADDTLKNVLSHGVSAAAQITSATSECKTVRADITAVVSDPALSSFLSDLLTELLHGIEIEETADDDLVGGLVNSFLEFYKEADKATVQHELEVLGNTVGVLAEEHLLAKVFSGSADFGSLLEERDTLSNVVEAISGLSAFGPTLENAFKLGITMMDETLQIPTDDAEAYDNFIEDLLTKMQKSDSTSFDLNTIRYYVVKCAEKGAKVSASNGIKGHSQFIAYVTHWEKVQSAFSHAAEDTSYGYFTIEINGQWYIYDKNQKQIFIYDSEIKDAYKDKISPVAGLINALTLRSTQSRLTVNNLHSILGAYVASATDTTSVALANRMLSRDTFVSRAVTIEKMMAATDFSDWTAEERAKDSHICVDIVLQIMTLIDHLSTLDTLEGMEEAVDMLNEFTLLGEIMDDMKETSCINKLPALLLEGVVKNEAFAAVLKPSVAFQINNIVENNNKTYTECMNQIAGVLSWAINSFGSSFGG